MERDDDDCGEDAPAEADRAADIRIGARLALARQLAGLTAQDLADRLSWPVGRLDGYEGGVCGIPASALQSAADALALPVSWFYGPDDAAYGDGGIQARNAAALNRLDHALGTRTGEERAVLIASAVRLADELDRRRTLVSAALSGKAGHALAARQGGELPGPGAVAGGTVPVRRRILVVDDAADVLVTTGAFIEAEGHDVIPAGDADAALRVLASGERVDAIVTDYAMPDLSGVDFLLLAAQVRPGIPSLIITGFAELAGLAELPERIKVLQKPFRRAQFVGHLEALFGQSAPAPAPGGCAAPAGPG